MNARADDCRIVNTDLYVLRTDMPWRDLLERYGLYTTVYNRSNRWAWRGIWKKTFDELAPKSHNSAIVKAHCAASGAK